MAGGLAEEGSGGNGTNETSETMAKLIQLSLNFAAGQSDGG